MGAGEAGVKKEEGEDQKEMGVSGTATSIYKQSKEEEGEQQAGQKAKLKEEDGQGVDGMQGIEAAKVKEEPKAAEGEFAAPGSTYAEVDRRLEPPGISNLMKQVLGLPHCPASPVFPPFFYACPRVLAAHACRSKLCPY
jgi:hypothetical protein